MVGRKQEIERLEWAYQSPDPEFIGIYGRRRVGKTYLVAKTFAGRFTFQHAGLAPKGTDEEQSTEEGIREEGSLLKRQLTHFHTSLLSQGESGTEEPKSWEEAFLRMRRLIDSKPSNGEKKVVFLDELPWMDTPRSEFLTALEGFWNSWGCFQDNLLLIVCGSATSWMTDKLINNHGGLYGRLTGEIRLSPLCLGECKELLASQKVRLSDYDVAQAYMVFGGIPFYLKGLRPGQSLAQYIDQCFFAKNASLRREFDRLFSSVFVNPGTMQTIIRAISSVRSGLTRKQIEEKTGIKKGGRLTEYLRNLADSDFIVEYYPFGKGRKETYYRLVDPFCWFFLKFVDDGRSFPSDFWLNIIDNQQVVTWRGLAFENLCMNHVGQIKKALGVYGVSSEESAYITIGRDGDAGGQIDLVILRKDDICNLCEAKFYSDKVRIDKAMERKAVHNENLLYERLSKKMAVHKVLLTTFGVEEGEYMWTFTNVVTLEDLMKN